MRSTWEPTSRTPVVCALERRRCLEKARQCAPPPPSPTAPNRNSELVPRRAQKIGGALLRSLLRLWRRAARLGRGECSPQGFPASTASPPWPFGSCCQGDPAARIARRQRKSESRARGFDRDNPLLGRGECTDPAASFLRTRQPRNDRASPPPQSRTRRKAPLLAA